MGEVTRQRTDPEVRERTLRLMERGLTASNAAKATGASASKARDWWHAEHPGIPLPGTGGDPRPLRRVAAWERRATVVTYECPWCGGLIHHADVGSGKPWYCHWCGRPVK